MIDLDTRWPLAALPVHALDPWLAGRVAVYDLAACVDAEPARAPSRAAMVCVALRSLSSADMLRTLNALDMSGSAAVIVGVLVGAVLRMESARVGHMLHTDADRVESAVRAMSPSMVFRSMPAGRVGAA